MSATYAYNGRGERMSKTVNGALTRFRYGSDGQLLGEYVKAKAEPFWRFCERQGFAWKRRSRRWLYDTLGLFDAFRVSYLPALPKARPAHEVP